MWLADILKYQKDVSQALNTPVHVMLFISLNGNTAMELDLNGYSFGAPTSTVIQLPLQAGANQIEFSNPGNYAPNLDSIIISLPSDF